MFTTQRMIGSDGKKLTDCVLLPNSHSIHCSTSSRVELLDKRKAQQRNASIDERWFPQPKPPANFKITVPYVPPPPPHITCNEHTSDSILVPLPPVGRSQPFFPRPRNVTVSEKINHVCPSAPYPPRSTHGRRSDRWRDQFIIAESLFAPSSSPSSSSHKKKNKKCCGDQEEFQGVSSKLSLFSSFSRDGIFHPPIIKRLPTRAVGSNSNTN
jgi:hypothetical protein